MSSNKREKFDPYLKSYNKERAIYSLLVKTIPKKVVCILNDTSLKKQKGFASSLAWSFTLCLCLCLCLCLSGCKMVASAISVPLSFSIASRSRTSSIPLFSRRYIYSYMYMLIFIILFTSNSNFYLLFINSGITFSLKIYRNSTRSMVSALPGPYSDSLTLGNILFFSFSTLNSTSFKLLFKIIVGKSKNFCILSSKCHAKTRFGDDPVVFLSLVVLRNSLFEFNAPNLIEIFCLGLSLFHLIS